MNTSLKVLAVIACVAVIIASAVVILDHFGPPKPPPPSNTASTPTNQQTGAQPQSSSYKPDQRNAQKYTNTIEVADNPIQPTYRPINQPTYLQLIRQEGKTYHSIVMGKLSGRASKADWGMQGTAFFNYLYGLDSSGKILKNDGVTILEERSFTKVQEELLVSEYEFGIDLGDRIRSIIQYASEVPSTTVQTIVGFAQSMDGQKVSIKKGWVDAARNLGIFKDFPQVDPEQFERELRMFSAGTNDRLLEGKTVRITFVDGQGITKIEPINCTLSEKECDVIIRSNFALDHYVFPDRQVSPGEEWDIDGDVLGGFLDPRISGNSRGVKLGNTVVTVGFPNPDIQGFSPKFAKGDIASLAGGADEPRYFQISVPVQPGNSGGALVDEHGNVVGVVSAKLDELAVLESSGSLPENVNYAVKSSFLLKFIESKTDVLIKLKVPHADERKIADIVNEVQRATVMVVVYNDMEGTVF